MNLEPLLDVINVNSKQEIEESFAKAFSFPDQTAFLNFRKSQHFKYLKGYLFTDEDGLGAKTIVVEKDYTSLSYIGDYLNYYASCYHPYAKQCRRVHFFESEITKEEFVLMLINNINEEKWKGYLGHIVLKPLPKGIIGATLLSPYKKMPNRYYTAIRDYPVNLFGKDLNIKTLPYQEQDGIVGSCASLALWFAFQKTSELFDSKNLTPSDITISAGYDSFHTGKVFPSKSLNIKQICRAIYDANLISEVRYEKDFLIDKKWLKSFLYAYSRMGIPILLGLSLEKKGYHLVTVAGYKLAEENGTWPLSDKTSLKLVSDRVTKFFSHDDQCGPFARLEFNLNSEFTFKSSWWESIDSDIELNANVISIIVPLKESIKVTFEDILDTTNTISVVLRESINLEFEWNIYLIDSNTYKMSIRKKLNTLPNDYDSLANEILFVSLPKYIWVSQAKITIKEKSFLIFDMLHDAIDIGHKSSPYYVNIYNESFKKTIRDKNLEGLKIFKNKLYQEDAEKTDLSIILQETSDVELNKIEKLVNELKGDDTKTPVSEYIKTIRTEKKDELEKSVEEQKKAIEKRISRNGPFKT